MTRPPDEIESLLADGRLGGPARERILNRVIDAIEPRRMRRRELVKRAIMGLVPLTVACAVLVLVFGVQNQRQTDPGFRTEIRTKGPATPTEPAIDPLCRGEVGVCRPGDRLFFRVDPSPVRRWLVAYAEAVDAGAGTERLWMFPEVARSAPEIPVAAEPSILRRAVQVGTDLRPGRYRLTMILFDHAVGRAEASNPHAGGLRIVRSLVVR